MATSSPPAPGFNVDSAPPAAPPPATGYAPGATPGPAPAPPADDGRWILSYQDFVPNQTAPAQFLTSASYEPFSALVIRANQWLQQNPAIKVKICESIEIKQENSTFIDTNNTSYRESGKYSTFFVRCLRMWVVPKTAQDNPAPQQIGYLNIMPAMLGMSGGFFGSVHYATYGETITKINEMFQAQPLPGRILNIETIDVKSEGMGNNINPDESYWRESGKFTTFFLNVIRLFYEAGPPCHEQIGTLDFVPALQNFSMNQEPMSALLQRVNQWIQQNPNLPVCNVQSLDFKIHSSFGGGGGAAMDTQRSYYCESGKYSTAFMRIIRVYYVSGTAYRQPVQAISYKTFLPAQLSASMFSVTYEPVNQVMARAMAWLKLTNAKVIGCETHAVKLGGLGIDLASSSEATYYRNSGRYAETFVFVIRVFLDGFYQDPPPELLPPPPQMTQTQSSSVECCAIL